MRYFRHAPLTFWVVIVALLAGAALFALSSPRPAAADHELTAMPSSADKAQVQQLRNRLPVLMQLAQSGDRASAADWADMLAAEARTAAVGRQARVGAGDGLVTAYNVFADEAAAVRDAEELDEAVARVLAAGDLLANAAFGGDGEALPPGFGGNLDPGAPAELDARPDLPAGPSLVDPAMPGLPDADLTAPNRPQLANPTVPGLDTPALPVLDTPDLPEVSPADTAEILGVDPARLREPVPNPQLPGLTLPGWADAAGSGADAEFAPPPAPPGAPVPAAEPTDNTEVTD